LIFGLFSFVATTLKYDSPESKALSTPEQSHMEAEAYYRRRSTKKQHEHDVDSPDYFTTAQNGVFFFIHVPKTGGTTIRDNFSNTSRFPAVTYLAVYSLKQFRAAKALLDSRLSGRHTMKTSSSNEILFVEVHGHNTPSLLDLERQLRDWKEQARANNIPFFVFTVLREPLDLAVSFFNFFHVSGDKRFGPQMKASLVNLRRTLQWNPQCLYLVKGERPYFRPDLSYNVSQQDCDNVAALLQDNRVLDWVGDTERLSKDTLPMLVQMIQGNQRTRGVSSDNGDLSSLSLQASNVASTRQQRNEPLSKSALDSVTVEEIRRFTRLDSELYESILRRP